MKRIVFAILMFVCGITVTNAQQGGSNWTQITFEVGIWKPVSGGNPVPKTPTTIPDVYLDGHTLYIDSIGYNCTIQIADITDTVVYSVFVPNGTTTVLLPSTLTGTYTLSLIPETGSYYFFGDVTF